MFVDNVLIRPHGDRDVSISWSSETPEHRSWIYINTKFVVGPFMAETCQRMIVLPVPTDKTFKIEVHDFIDDEIIPNSVEESPLVKPLIAWNGVESAVSYRIYHTIHQARDVRQEAGEISHHLFDIPNNYVSNTPASSLRPPALPRMEIDCPVKLEGKGGRWHSFRVEAVDQFGNESQNDVIPYFAADYPKPPELAISRDTATCLLTFRIQ